MTYMDNQGAAAQVAGWLGEGYATWSARLHGVWFEYQIEQAGAHPMAAVLEQHLPAAAVAP